MSVECDFITFTCSLIYWNGAYKRTISMSVKISISEFLNYFLVNQMVDNVFPYHCRTWACYNDDDLVVIYIEYLSHSTETIVTS